VSRAIEVDIPVLQDYRCQLRGDPAKNGADPGQQLAGADR
jgi:hypothetical protein